MAIKTFLINSNQANYEDSEFGALQSNLFSNGLLNINNSNNDFLVEENLIPDLSVLVNPGGAFIEYLKNLKTWKIVVQSNAQDNLAISPNTSGSDRVDAVIIHIKQDEPNELKNNVGELLVIDGTGITALTDGDIDTVVGDNNWYRLSDITVVNNAVSILNADINKTSFPVIFGLNSGGYKTTYIGDGQLLEGLLNSPVNEDILPDVGSTRNIGSPINTFDQGHFDFLYGDGAGITNVTPSTTSMVAGEIINGAATPQPVYISDVDGKVYIADSSTLITGDVFGWVSVNVVTNDPVTVLYDSIVGGFAGLIPGRTYFLTDTPGTIGLSKGTYSFPLGKATSTTELRFDITKPMTIEERAMIRDGKLIALNGKQVLASDSGSSSLRLDVITGAGAGGNAADRFNLVLRPNQVGLNGTFLKPFLVEVDMLVTYSTFNKYNLGVGIFQDLSAASSNYSNITIQPHIAIVGERIGVVGDLDMNLFISVGDGATQTLIPLGLTANTGIRRLYKIEFDGLVARFYVDNSLVGEVSTNLPIAGFAPGTGGFIYMSNNANISPHSVNIHTKSFIYSN